MPGNNPRILVEFAREDAAYIMDLLHSDWNLQVMASALVDEGAKYDSHIWKWRKHRASRLLRHIDDSAERQGFWEDGKGL